MHNLLAFAARRFVALIVVVWAITTITFFLTHLSPYDPIRPILGQKLASDPHEYYVLRHLFGLDQPLGLQYLNYLGGLLHGNLGYSEEASTLGRPVWDLLRVGVPVSLTLGAMRCSWRYWWACRWDSCRRSRRTRWSITAARPS